MEYAVLGWPEDGPQLRLDHREFSYAGKFVMSNTGKAVAREGDIEQNSDGDHRLIAAVAFNEDRTDPATAWLRYVTVREDRRGEGIGARLTRFVTVQLRGRGYDRVKIAVNNPFAYHALYKAGFGYTGEQTGLAELVLVRPGPDELTIPDGRAGPEDTVGPEDRAGLDDSTVPDDRATERYQAGLDVYRERDDLASEERAFLAAKANDSPPDVVGVPE